MKPRPMSAERREQLLNGPDVNVVGHPWAGGAREGRQIDPDAPVPAKVAIQNAQLSMGVGFVAGALIGAGVGALLVWGVRKIFGR